MKPVPLRRRLHRHLARGGAVASLLFAGGPRAAPAREPAWLAAGPMVGHVTTNQAMIWVKGSGPARVSVEFGEEPTLRRNHRTTVTRLAEPTAFAATIVIPGLRAQTRYYYRVRVNGELATVRPYPVFATAPRPEDEPRFRFGFGSCVGRAGYLDAAAWADMARTNMDFFLMLGDNHYADTTEAAGQRAGYLAHRSQPSFAAFAARVPIYGIWDDHDFGPNNSDGTAAGKEESLQTFREHWANPGYGLAEDPGVYCRFRRGEAEFFLLDVRYHRSPNRAPGDGSKTMLGTRQLAWLKDGLLSSTARLKFLASGSEWQSQGTEDSWASFMRERSEIFEFIRQNRIEGVVLISGDRHFTAAYQVEGRFLEVTSGPLGSAPVTPRPAPELFLKFDPGHYYTIFEVDAARDESVLKLEVFRAADGWVATRVFTWDELNGRKKIEAPGD